MSPREKQELFRFELTQKENKKEINGHGRPIQCRVA